MRRSNENNRGDTTDRIVALTIRAGKGTLPSVVALARELGVHPRTIRRYLTAIERHMPVRVEAWP